MQISEVDPRNLHASGRSGLPGASQGTPLIRLLVLVGITLELLGILGGLLQALRDLLAAPWTTLGGSPDTSWAPWGYLPGIILDLFGSLGGEV